MKVLFAINNDSISEAVVKKYQRDYKKIMSYKNVYYFNAILKELQNDKTYDRIIISEDLEPFANNNYDTIDKFLFEKLEKVKDEISQNDGKNTEVVIICADRRNKSDEMLNKLFGIEIYNALVGDDRNIDELCRIINQPRTRREAKLVYKIQGNIENQIDDESGVSELEVQNILAHYKRLGKNEDKYLDSFNNIISQYTDAQLKIIIRYLPLHVKAVLEEQSPKYRSLSTVNVLKNREQETYTSKSLKVNEQKNKEDNFDVKLLKSEKEEIKKPIVIPSELNNEKNVKIQQKSVKKEIIDNDIFSDDELEETPKKGRGRPRKNPVKEQDTNQPKRGRGRPKKVAIEEQNEEDFDIDLFNIDSSNNEVDTTLEDMDFDLFNMDQEERQDNHEDELESLDLFDIDTIETDSDDENIDLFNIDKQEDDYFSVEEDVSDNTEETGAFQEENYYPEPTVKNTVGLNSLLTNEKKIVSFVGTTKNGTSFIVNNLGLVLSEMNISTAILDMTQNKNSYYIFTNNEDKLRRIAEGCISKLEQGIAEGIKVDKNLTVYTEVPGERNTYENLENILASLVEKHDVVLIDTDFNTNPDIFEKSQEIYLVQSMDVLTIQPLTAFLRNLKTKNILKQEKIKIVINKEQKLRNLNDNLLIGGMSSYNDPSMTLMTELFNKDNVKYCKIPFEAQNYFKYLDSLVNCEIYLRGYTKTFLNALNDLAQMVYPLLNKTKYTSKSKQKNRMEFSNKTRDTLDRMKKNY